MGYKLPSLIGRKRGGGSHGSLLTQHDVTVLWAPGLHTFVYHLFTSNCLAFIFKDFLFDFLKLPLVLDFLILSLNFISAINLN